MADRIIRSKVLDEPQYLTLKLTEYETQVILSVEDSESGNSQNLMSFTLQGDSLVFRRIKVCKNVHTLLDSDTDTIQEKSFA